MRMTRCRELSHSGFLHFLAASWRTLSRNRTNACSSGWSNCGVIIPEPILVQPRLSVEHLPWEAQVVGNCSSRRAPSYPTTISPVHLRTWERLSR
jgi:hypothetical protein